ncbi:CHAT domain-containing protein [Kitasatospora sp. NPDC056531]|uniref:CHAT domain-containing protein n=1 Tax=Kitasatospora sp. NPDC056531 TaxID=3345856 RepID=UPI0036BB3FC6
MPKRATRHRTCRRSRVGVRDGVDPAHSASTVSRKSSANSHAPGHDAAAPAFQCLYLAPDQRSDGRLHAHELLGLELRGLDLVTLSACETALGRFDASDNPRGLPAALLLSGAHPHPAAHCTLRTSSWSSKRAKASAAAAPFRSAPRWSGAPSWSYVTRPTGRAA